MHITDKVIGHMYDFCNQKVKGNRTQISAIAHNLFSFFFFLKGLRLGVCQTTNLSIGGANLTNINFSNEQLKFIDTVKYYQQSLSTLVVTMTEKEKENAKIKFKRFILGGRNLSQRFLNYNLEEQELVLNYLSSGKGIIHYEMIKKYDLQDIKPEKDFY